MGLRAVVPHAERVGFESCITIRRPTNGGGHAEPADYERPHRRMIVATVTNTTLVNAATTTSPAKINLTLQVTRRRDDGFHDIASDTLAAQLHDTIRFRRNTDGIIRLTCDHARLPTDQRNLIIRAARKLAELSATRYGADIELIKRIPLGAGLAGGSGNAAATLAALNHLWQLNLPDQQLASIGARLGSDVALFFALPSAHLAGRGERVHPIRLRWSGWVLLVFAGCPVSTKDVYAAWEPRDSAPCDHDLTRRVCDARTADELAGLCINQLEPAVFRVAPRVRDMFQALCPHLPRNARITGAGQTAFVLFDDPQEAEFVKSRLVSNALGTETCLVRTMTGPLTIE